MGLLSPGYAQFSWCRHSTLILFQNYILKQTSCQGVFLCPSPYANEVKLFASISKLTLQRGLYFLFSAACEIVRLREQR
jgi:hypothetical protein